MSGPAPHAEGEALRRLALSIRRESALWPKTERAQQTARLLLSIASDIEAIVAPLSGPVDASGEPEPWTALDGSLTIRFLQYINVKRAERWHGLNSWSALEWAGAMAGEAGEACNAAKKLKRIDDEIANINLEDGRSLTDRESASAKIVDEIADTVIYGVLLASRVGMDLEEAIRMKFNRKSDEYGFPERIPPNQTPAAAVPSSPAQEQIKAPDGLIAMVCAVCHHEVSFSTKRCQCLPPSSPVADKED